MWFVISEGYLFTCSHLSSASWALFSAFLPVVDFYARYTFWVSRLVSLNLSPDCQYFTLFLDHSFTDLLSPPLFYIMFKYWIWECFLPPMTVLNLNTVWSLLCILECDLWAVTPSTLSCVLPKALIKKGRSHQEISDKYLQKSATQGV